MRGPVTVVEFEVSSVERSVKMTIFRCGGFFLLNVLIVVVISVLLRMIITEMENADKFSLQVTDYINEIYKWIGK